MERGSVRHSSRVDDALAADVEDLLHEGTNARENRSQEQPTVAEIAAYRARELGGRIGPGFSYSSARMRSDLARWLHGSSFPADATTLLRDARAELAPSHVLAALADLPAGPRFETVGDVWRALGRPVETRPNGSAGREGHRAPATSEFGSDAPLLWGRVDRTEIQEAAVEEAVASSAAAAEHADPWPHDPDLLDRVLVAADFVAAVARLPIVVTRLVVGGVLRPVARVWSRN